MTTVVLASASPRRHELLARIGVQFTVRAPDIDESPRNDEAPVEYVRRLASAKASAVCASPDELVIAADTTVDLDSHILGKPVDDGDAARSIDGGSTDSFPRLHVEPSPDHDAAPPEPLLERTTWPPHDET